MPGTVVVNPVSSVLYDENGNKVGVIIDGSFYRLQVEAKLAPGHGLATEATVSGILTELLQKTEPADTQIVGDGGGSLTVDGPLTDTQLRASSIPVTISNPLGQKTMVSGVSVTIASDQSDLDTVIKDEFGTNWSTRNEVTYSGVERPGPLIYGLEGTGQAHHAHMIVDPDDTYVHRIQTEARIAPGSRISIVPVGISEGDLGNLFRQFLTTDGLSTGPSSLIVDGSVTPQVFYMPAHPTLNTVLTEIRFTFTALSFDWGGIHFGKGGGTLTNGIKIEMIANNGTSVDFGTVKVNEELMMLPVRASVVLDHGGNRDIMALSIDLGGLAILEAGTGDLVKVTVQDNLTGGTRDINYFKFAAYGVRVTPS